MSTKHMTNLSGFIHKYLLVLACGILASVIITGHYLLNLAMDATTEYYLDEEANWIISNIPYGQTIAQQAGPRTFTWNRNDLPNFLQGYLTDHPQSIDNISYIEKSDAFFYFIAIKLADQQYLYGWHELPTSWEAHQLQSIFTKVIALGFITALLVIVLAICIARSISKPISDLSLWSQQGASDTLPSSVDRFTETHALATTLDSTLKALEQANENERLMLRSLSHEINTPLAIARAALDLLRLTEPNRQEVKAWRSLESAHIRLEDRVKAILNLWQPQSATDFQACSIESKLEKLIQQTGEEHRFSLTVDHPIEVNAPPVLLEVLLSNLINNANQYANEQTISVTLNAFTLDIKNAFSTDGHEKIAHDARHGYGVGLLLCERICHKLSWHLSLHQRDNQFIATVTFT